MANNFIQPGDTATYTNAGTALVSGQVVRIGQVLAVALDDIPNGGSGAVALTGVFRVPKVSGAVIAQGEALTWDASAAAFDDNAATPATGDVTGAAAVAFEAAGAGVTAMLVRFTGVPGTVS